MSESLPIHVNEANEAELRQLRHIGPKRAEPILAWRSDTGPIPDLTTFGQVAGLGPGQVAQIATLLRFAVPRADQLRRPALTAAGICSAGLITMLVLGMSAVPVASTFLSSAVAAFLAALATPYGRDYRATLYLPPKIRAINAVAVMLPVATWLAAAGALIQFLGISIFIAGTVRSPSLSYAAFRHYRWPPERLQFIVDTYASAPVAALALAVGLLAAEAEAILAAFFAIWSAAIVVVNLRGRIDPAGGFAAALGAPQREDLERLQSAGLLLLPEDDPGPGKLHVLQGLAWAIGFAGVVTLVADVAG